VVVLNQCIKLVQRSRIYYQYCERRPHFLTFYEERQNTIFLIDCYFISEKGYLSPKKCKFCVILSFFAINKVKMTWETCVEAYKISKIQELPGIRPWTPSRDLYSTHWRPQVDPQIPCFKQCSIPLTSILGSATVIPLLL
jgi:hypothetical protein